MNQPATIPTPTKYMLQRSAKRGLPLLFFAVVCGLSGLLWKYQSRSEVLIGEVEVVEHLVASPDSGTVAQLVPSEGQTLDTYVTVAKDQLLIQLDDNPVRSQLDAIEQELLAVSDEVTNEMARLKSARRSTKIVSVTTDENETEPVETEPVETEPVEEVNVEDEVSEEETVEEPAESDEIESDETPPVEQEDKPTEEPADTETDEPHEEQLPVESTPHTESSRSEEANVEEANAESDIWIATQSLVDQSLSAVEVARKELDLRQFDTEIANAKSEIIATGGDLESLETFKEERREANDAIFAMKSELGSNRSAAFAQIPQENLSATSRLVFRSLQNRVKSAETQLLGVHSSVERLDVMSPVDGQIEETLVQLRQAVTSGQPLLTIVPQRGTIVVVYVREQSLFRPFAGMPVTLRSRIIESQQVDAVVEAVGPKVEEIPERHRKNPKIVEWGRPMRIRVPDQWNVEPGSLLDVILD